MNRRHDIDALRALAFGLVILYHLAMAYVGGWHWHLKSVHSADWLQWPMLALNLWRMDLVFLISGLAFGFIARSQRPLMLIRLRSLRLLLPLAFGMAVVVPYQPYAQGVANGLITPGFGEFLLRYYSGGPWPRDAFDGWDFGVTWNHLWYLAYLWVYTVALALLLPLAQSPAGLRLRDGFRALRGWHLLLVPVLPLALYSALLWPQFRPTHDLIHDAWLHAVYFTLFVYGWWIGLDAGLWAELTRLRRRALAWAVVLFVAYAGLRLAVTSAPELRPLARLVADLYLWAVIVAVLGWARHRLNRPWPWLGWAQESVYPWYMLHQTVIIVALVVLAPLQLGAVAEPLALLVLTALVCWGLTDGLVRRVGVLRRVFGLTPRAQPQHPSPMTPERPAARNA